MSKKTLLLSILLIACGSFQNAQALEYIQAPAAIQVSSVISDGKYTVSEIVAVAKQNNIGIVVITDRDSMRWEYGLWPLRNIIKKTVRENSVFSFGILGYLREIRRAQEQNPAMVILPGIESAPFYYWQGSVFRRTLKINNWHKHILVMGLTGPKEYAYLPVTGNRRGLILPFRFKNIFYWLLPLAALVSGAYFVSRRRFSYKDEYGRKLGPRSPVGLAIGLILVMTGALFLINNYPYRDIAFDQYRGDLGIKPYQNFIEYVYKNGGLTFWAHPEAKNIEHSGNVTIDTREYSSDLLHTTGYTGFAVFHEGYEKVGAPGGIWDDILIQYCKGLRKKPVWAIGGLGFDTNGDLNDYIRDLRTVVLTTALDRKGALEALEAGRMYVARGNRSSQFMLDGFVVKDAATGDEATMGQEIVSSQSPVIKVSGHFLSASKDTSKDTVMIKLIKNGRVIKTFEEATPFELSYTDEMKGSGGAKAYYRIEIASGGLLLVTNPVFIERKPGK